MPHWFIQSIKICKQSVNIPTVLSPWNYVLMNRNYICK